MAGVYISFISTESWPRRRYGRLLLILMVMTTIVLLSFFLNDYYLGLLVQSFMFALVAMTTDIIWGYAGILTFASAAMFGIGAYALGIGFVQYSTSSVVVFAALIAAVLVAGILSAVIGWLAFYSRTRVSEFYIAVVTLGVSVLFGQVVLYGGAVTGGSNGLSGFSTLPIGNRAWYLLTGLALVGALAISMKIVNSDFGLLLRAVRDNETRGRYIGIKTPFVKTLVFSLCNAAIAAVGVVYALYSTVVAPSLVGIALATNVLIWVILGGRATLLGPALAAILVTGATPQLSTTIPLYWQGLLGLVFVAVVIFLPKGVLPAIWGGLKSVLAAVGIWNDAPAEGNMSAGGRFDIRPATKRAKGDGTVLDVARVSKNFGSFHALSDVSLTVKRGELLSIVGPNGAGKTSLVRCICDGDERTVGSILVDGNSIERSSPEEIAALGVARKFQSASVFESLTVGDCIKVATWRGHTPSAWKQDRKLMLSPDAAEVVTSLGLSGVWDVPASDISHGQRQALELAMVLALEPSVVILDEPTAGLTNQERELVGDVLKRLVQTKELAVILIEHDFEFVKSISTRIVVLVGGRLVADGTVEEVASSEIVRNAYLGRTHEVSAA